jgi:putative copper resistance protein D
MMECVVMMPDAPDLSAVVTTWTLAPVADVLILAGTVGYVRLATRTGSSMQRWPRRRIAAWAGAVLTLVVALNSSVAAYAQVLFWVHMVQHLMLIMVVPVLLVWAQPVRLMVERGGPRTVERTTAVLGGRIARAATAPPATLAFYAAVVVLTHLTGFQEVARADFWAHGLELVLYLLSGYLFLLPLVGSERTPWTVPYLLRLAILAASMGVDTLVGIVLMLTPHAVAPGYGTAHPGWGPGALADQEIAGAIMWVAGDGLMMLLMIVIGVRWGMAGAAEQTMGRWLEGARASTVLGAGSRDVSVDDDDDALAAYNARLATLHGLASGEVRRTAERPDLGDPGNSARPDGDR